MTTASAQEGGYITIFGSYGLPAASTSELFTTGVTGRDTLARPSAGVSWHNSSTYLRTNPGNENSDPPINPFNYTDSTISQVKINLGKGVNFGVSFGYMFNDNIGVELGIGYFLGSKTSFKQEYTDETNPLDIQYSSLTGEIYANQFRINPSLVVSTDFHDFMPYAKFGVTIGMGTKVYETYVDEKYSTLENITQKYESKGGVAIGVNAAVGALFQFNKKTGIFLEFATTAMSYAPTKRTLTAYTIDGDNIMNSDLLPIALETEYVSEFSGSNNGTESTVDADPTQTSQSTKIRYPFSTFNINLGVRFSF